MAVKYRISDIAKDFGMSSKEIGAMLEPLGGEPKKSSHSLEENELDFIFNKLTKDNEVKSFDEYFAIGNEKRTRAEREKEEELKKLEQIKKDYATPRLTEIQDEITNFVVERKPIMFR